MEQENSDITNIIKDTLDEANAYISQIKSSQKILKDKMDLKDENEKFLEENGIPISSQVKFYVSIKDEQEKLSTLYAKLLDLIIDNLKKLKSDSKRVK